MLEDDQEGMMDKKFESSLAHCNLMPRLGSETTLFAAYDLDEAMKVLRKAKAEGYTGPVVIANLVGFSIKPLEKAGSLEYARSRLPEELHHLLDQEAL